MKTIMTPILVTGLALFCFALLFVALPAHAAETPGGGQRVLIAYFSRTGNTAEVARHIQAETGGDLFEIRTVRSYPDDYTRCTEVAMEEQKQDARPALSTRAPNMADYDTVFIGHPIWWGAMPMALFTFLEAYDFSGKMVVPFCTHGGGGRGRSFDDLKTALPGATVLDGFASRGSAAQNDVASWLHGLDL